MVKRPWDTAQLLTLTWQSQDFCPDCRPLNPKSNALTFPTALILHDFICSMYVDDKFDYFLPLLAASCKGFSTDSVFSPTEKY